MCCTWVRINHSATPLAHMPQCHAHVPRWFFRCHPGSRFRRRFTSRNMRPGCLAATMRACRVRFKARPHATSFLPGATGWARQTCKRTHRRHANMLDKSVMSLQTHLQGCLHGAPLAANANAAISNASDAHVHMSAVCHASAAGAPCGSIQA